MNRTLDVVVCTYNRCEQLAKTIRSLLEAPHPPELSITVIVVDNNCTDGTAEMVRQIESRGGIRLRYVQEKRQGLSNARNGGIAAGSAELIGFIDDDEQVDPSWYNAIAREFKDPSVEFIGGPYLPLWGAAAPRWLPPDSPGVIGISRPEPYSEFNEKFSSILKGGNAVIKRSVFDRVGIYSTQLGRTDKGLLSMEDEEFYLRLLRNGIRGVYVPDLVIHHYIPPERLTKTYHRRWFFWHAVSQGVFDRSQRPDVAHFAGIPRYLIGNVVRGFLSIPRNLLAGKPAEAFQGELPLWTLMGNIYGKYWFNSKTR